MYIVPSAQDRIRTCALSDANALITLDGKFVLHPLDAGIELESHVLTTPPPEPVNVHSHQRCVRSPSRAPRVWSSRGN